MITQRFYLKEYFPELGENGCNAYMDAYIPSAFENAGEALATKNTHVWWCARAVDMV